MSLCNLQEPLRPSLVIVPLLSLSLVSLWNVLSAQLGAWMLPVAGQGVGEGGAWVACDRDWAARVLRKQALGR